jgi:hypothetical protein
MTFIYNIFRFHIIQTFISKDSDKNLVPSKKLEHIFIMFCMCETR